MAKGLRMAEPPRRRIEEATAHRSEDRAPRAVAASVVSQPKFDQIAEGEKVQFNKRVTRATADGYEILAIRVRRKVPDLLAEALALLEEKYGKV